MLSQTKLAIFLIYHWFYGGVNSRISGTPAIINQWLKPPNILIVINESRTHLQKKVLRKVSRFILEKTCSLAQRLKGVMIYERCKRGANSGCEKRICHNKVSSQTLTDCILETKSKATRPNPWAFPRENTFAYSFTVSGRCPQQTAWKACVCLDSRSIKRHFLHFRQFRGEHTYAYI